MYLVTGLSGEVGASQRMVIAEVVGVRDFIMGAVGLLRMVVVVVGVVWIGLVVVVVGLVVVVVVVGVVTPEAVVVTVM